jgi:hypothetical protein
MGVGGVEGKTGEGVKYEGGVGVGRGLSWRFELFLRTLLTVRVLSTELVSELLYWDGNERSHHYLLRKFEKEGLIVRLPERFRGRTLWTYTTLAKRDFWNLCSGEVALANMHRWNGSYEHQLLIAQAYVAYVGRGAAKNRLDLAFGPLWQDGLLRAETFQYGGEWQSVAPDVYLGGYDLDRTIAFLEMDRGTIPGKRMGERLERYRRFGVIRRRGRRKIPLLFIAHTKERAVEIEGFGRRLNPEAADAVGFQAVDLAGVAAALDGIVARSSCREDSTRFLGQACGVAS